MADDLVDIMGGPRNAPKQASADVIERGYGDDMSMQEFVQWMNTNYGAGLGVKEALQQAAFMLCCDVIAQDMAKATLRLHKRTGPKTSQIVEPKDHPVAAFYATEPNQRHTWPEFKEMMGLWACLTRNAFAVTVRDLKGDFLALIPVQSARVSEKISGRDIFYDVTAGTQHEQALLGRSMITVPERDMIHVRLRMLDGMYGYSTLIAGKGTLETGRAIEEYRTELFGDDAQIRGVFVRDEKLDPLPELLFQRLKTQMRALMMRVRRDNDPIVLEGGVKFEKLSVNPEEAELTKQLEAQVNATCRLLRVPPHKVFHLDGSKYENLETMDKMYVGDTMIPVCQPFEHRYDRALLSSKERREFFTQHDRDEMTIKDTKAETERATKALERGGITFDEFRARLGYNPLPSGQGQARMIPSNMNVVDLDGNVIIRGSGKTDEPKDDEKSDEKPGDDETKAGLRLVHNN